MLSRGLRKLGSRTAGGAKRNPGVRAIAILDRRTCSLRVSLRSICSVKMLVYGYLTVAAVVVPFVY